MRWPNSMWVLSYAYYSTGNPSGKAFGVDNNKDAYIAFRAYIDVNTQVGPSLFEIIWDRAILFTKAR